MFAQLNILDHFCNHFWPLNPLTGVILGKKLFCSKHMQVGCTDNHNRMPWSHYTITAHIEPSNRRKCPKLFWGPFWGQKSPFRGPWTFSPNGWFNMRCNCIIWSGHSVAMIWTPHMPMFRSKQLSTKNGPLLEGIGAQKVPFGPWWLERDPICAIKHIYLIDQHNSSWLGLFGLMGPLKPFMGPQGLCIGPKGPFLAL